MSRLVEVHLMIEMLQLAWGVNMFFVVLERAVLGFVRFAANRTLSRVAGPIPGLDVQESWAHLCGLYLPHSLGHVAVAPSFQSLFLSFPVPARDLGGGSSAPPLPTLPLVFVGFLPCPGHLEYPALPANPLTFDEYDYPRMADQDPSPCLELAVTPGVCRVCPGQKDDL